MSANGILLLVTIAVGAHIALSWVQAIYRGTTKLRKVQKDDFENGIFPVSTLVPAWNKRGRIELCIQSLQKLAYPSWEALVIAGGPDGTFEAAMKATEGDDAIRKTERKMLVNQTAMLCNAGGNVLPLPDVYAL